MFTRRSSEEVGLFLTLLGLGVIFGNILLIYLSLIPLCFILISFLVKSPSTPKIERAEKRISAAVNEKVRVRSKLNVDRGIGLVTIADILPDHFALTEGNNFKVFWKGGERLVKDFEYEVKCTRRGIYQIGNSQSETMHFSSLEQTRLLTDPALVELIVRQPITPFWRARSSKLISRVPIPLAATSRLGMVTTDFREIRSYTRGDPYRFINWKATARLTRSRGGRPFVNEFEKEGKKTVWIFLDSSKAMSIGTEIENPFEYALQAASWLSNLYLSRGCDTGLYLYNGGKIILPESGRRQSLMIERALLEAEISEKGDGLKEAVDSNRGHLIGANPLFIIITTLSRENLGDIVGGVHSMLSNSSTRRSHQTMLINIAGYDLVATQETERAAASLLSLEGLSLTRAVGPRVKVIAWNPRVQKFPTLIINGGEKIWG